LRPLVVVRGIHVEEVGRRAGGLDVRSDGLRERQRRLAVEVHADDAHAVTSERARGRGAEAARRAEDEAPLALERAPCSHAPRLLDACPPGNARLRSRPWAARATDRVSRTAGGWIKARTANRSSVRPRRSATASSGPPPASIR